MPDPADLTAFLREQLDEDEKLATDALGLEVSIDVDWGSHAVLHHIHRRSSKRVLDEVAAKRAILDLHAIVHRDIGWLEDDDGDRVECYAELPVCGLCVARHSHFPTRQDVPTGECATVRALAQSFRGVPGWRNEWAIED